MSLLKALRGHTIFPVCPKCRREGARLVVADLIERFGEEADTVNVLERCRCSGCGRKGIPNVTMSWMQEAPPPGPGMGWSRQ